MKLTFQVYLFVKQAEEAAVQGEEALEPWDSQAGSSSEAADWASG